MKTIYKMPKYLFHYHDIQKLSIAELSQTLWDTEGLPMKDCKISDLVFYQGEPIYSGNGVYLFRTKDEFIYVGDCVARNFVERVPSHLDIRSGGWFNSLLKNTIKKRDKHPILTDDLLTKAAQEVFDDFQLILINFKSEDYNKVSINKLEYLLRIVMKPLNKFKTKWVEDWDILVENYVG